MKISLIFLILSNYWMLSLFLFGYLPTKTIADRSEDNKMYLSYVVNNRTQAIINATNLIPALLMGERINPMALIYDVFPETKVLQNKNISKFYDPDGLGGGVGLFENPIGLSTRIVFFNSWNSDPSIPVNDVFIRLILYLRRLRELCRKIIHNYEANDSRVRLRLTADMIKLDHEIHQTQVTVNYDSYSDFYEPSKEEIERKEAIRMALLQIDDILRKMQINPDSSIYDVIPITREVKNDINEIKERFYDIKLYDRSVDIFQLPIGETIRRAFYLFWNFEKSVRVNYPESRVPFFLNNLEKICKLVVFSYKNKINLFKYRLEARMFMIPEPRK